MHGGTQQLDAPTPGASTGDVRAASRVGSRLRVGRLGGPRPARRPVLPSSRAVVGGLLVAVAMIAVYLGAAGAAHGPTAHAVVARHAVPIGHRLTADDL